MVFRKPQEIEIKTPYFRYAAKKWEHPDGLPLLALHGWLDNAASFDHIACRLHKAQIIAFDLPGHGLSDARPPGAVYHLIDYAFDLVAVANELKWEKFSLLGHSLGANIASVIAATFPSRISKLILIEGIGPLSKRSDVSPHGLRRSIQEFTLLQKDIPLFFKTLREAINMRSKTGNLRMSSIETLAKRGVVKGEKGFCWRIDPRLKASYPQYFTEEQVIAFLDAIQAPTLLIRGSSGLLRDDDRFKVRCSHIKNLKVVTLSGGHHLHLDDPASVEKVIAEFLDE